MTVKKKISVYFLAFIIVCACIPIIVYIQPVSASGSPDLIAWLTADHHYPCPDKDTLATHWEDALEDVENDIGFDFDICLMLGDIVQSGGGDEPGEGCGDCDDTNVDPYNFTWRSKGFRNETYDNMPSGHTMNDFYSIAGNHEVRWVNGTDDFIGVLADLDYRFDWNDYFDPYGNNESTSYVSNSNRTYPVDYSFIGYNEGAGSELMYTIETGNVLWIMMSPNLTAPCNHDGPGAGSNGANYTYGFDYFTSLVENNSDKSIILCTHHAPHIESVFPNFVEEKAVQDMFHNWLKDNDNTVVAWLFGHKHAISGSTRYYDFSNSPSWDDFDAVVINVCPIDRSCHGKESHSFFFNFTEGSTDVELANFCHATDSGGDDVDFWDVSGDPGCMGSAFSLLFSFSLDGGSGGSDVSFVSINGQGNESYLSVVNRTFVWTNVTDVDRFQLQIDNSSTFASPFVDLSDINKTNYPSHYSASGDNVTFVLPDAYNITYWGCHYYRVRVLVEGG